MVEIVKSIDGQKISSVYIVGDLHGCYSLLMQELKKIDFDFQERMYCEKDIHAFNGYGLKYSSICRCRLELYSA